MARKKVDSKTLSQQKTRRRQWITFVRMCRYGVNNFSRNAWLTVAATAIMTITLLVIFSTFVARNVLVDTGDKISDNVGISIYLKTDTTQDDVDTIVSEIKQIPDVEGVTVSSPSDAYQKVVNDNKSNQEYLDALKEMNSQLPWTISVALEDINDTASLAAYVEDSQLVKDQSSRPASFAGERRVAIDTIAQAVSFAQTTGLVVGALFTGISMLIIFNTIRMAIFNRREEIHMMKLIGADRSFIRGPFLIEAMMYGVIAAVIATGIGMFLVITIAPTLSANDIYIEATLTLLQNYIGFVALAMIAIGSVIGVVSSLFATHRYLKPTMD